MFPRHLSNNRTQIFSTFSLKKFQKSLFLWKTVERLTFFTKLLYYLFIMRIMRKKSTFTFTLKAINSQNWKQSTKFGSYKSECGTNFQCDVEISIIKNELSIFAVVQKKSKIWWKRLPTEKMYSSSLADYTCTLWNYFHRIFHITWKNENLKVLFLHYIVDFIFFSLAFILMGRIPRKSTCCITKKEEKIT